jgi:hypothetical protein
MAQVQEEIPRASARGQHFDRFQPCFEALLSFVLGRETFCVPISLMAEKESYLLKKRDLADIIKLRDEGALEEFMKDPLSVIAGAVNEYLFHPSVFAGTGHVAPQQLSQLESVDPVALVAFFQKRILARIADHHFPHTSD